MESATLCVRMKADRVFGTRIGHSHEGFWLQPRTQVRAWITPHRSDQGRGAGVGRGRGVGEHLPVQGVEDGVGVGVADGVGVGVGVPAEP
jgi:hypothetical protein